MRAIIQVVKKAEVRVNNESISRIKGGFLILIAVSKSDNETQVLKLADKIANLRILSDEAGKLNRSIRDSGGAILLVSQFTLYADISRGNRPSFIEAAPGAQAQALIELVSKQLESHGIEVQSGVFGAQMEVELINDGPITIILEA